MLPQPAESTNKVFSKIDMATMLRIIGEFSGERPRGVDTESTNDSEVHGCKRGGDSNGRTPSVKREGTWMGLNTVGDTGSDDLRGTL